MNKKNKEVLSMIPLISMFLALATILAILQIPMGFIFPMAPFLNLDFSMVVIVMSYLMFNFYFALIIGTITPFLGLPLMTYPDPIGAFFLMMLNIVLILSLHLSKKIKYKKSHIINYVLTSFIAIMITSLFSGIIGTLIIYPLYGYSFNNDMFILVWTSSFPFTLLKLTIIFSIV